MNSVRITNVRVSALLLMSFAALVSGCAGQSSLRVTAYDDPYFPESESLVISDCVFRESETGDLHIVGRVTADPLQTEVTGADQLIHLQVFWRPRPGKTFDDPSAADTVIRFARAAGAGRAEVFTGTGFVYPTRSTLPQRLSASVESGRLVVGGERGAADGAGNGPLRVVGRLEARPDGPLAIALIRRLDRLELQARSPRVATGAKP